MRPPAKTRVRLICLLLTCLAFSSTGLAQDNVVLVIIDGARYSETFGDPDRQYIPRMQALSMQGTIADEFYNDEYTWTSRAVPALWCGTWTEVRDTTYNGSNTQYTLSPSIFEYIRHDLALPADQCFYILKYISSLWLPSFQGEYGPDFWPTFHSEGSSDADVFDEAIDVLGTYHPRFAVVYFADVDHAGHSGIWNDYVDAIETVDDLVGDLWSFIQSDPQYQDNTVMMVTNDHGRHDDQHGGFSGHGDGCPGCRHIMMLAIGPGIKAGTVETTYRTIPDWGVTACEILGVDPAYASGDMMDEIFIPDAVHQSEVVTGPTVQDLLQITPNPFNATTTITLTLNHPAALEIEVYDVLGKRVGLVAAGVYAPGQQLFAFDGKRLPSGLYFASVRMDGHARSVYKMMLIR